MMKKFGYLALGVVIGAALTVSSSVFGASLGLIGKKIQGEAVVMVNGGQIDSAIIVDGKSYAPVRSIGAAAGYDIGFEPGKITLKSKGANSNMYNAGTRLDNINTGINKAKRDIAQNQIRYDEYTKLGDTVNADIAKAKIEEAQQRLEKLEAEKAELEKQQ